MPESESGRLTVLFAIITVFLVSLEVGFTAVRDEWSGFGERLVLNLIAIAVVAALFILPKLRAERSRRPNE